MCCPSGIVARICDPHAGHNTFSIFISIFLFSLAYRNYVLKIRIRKIKQVYENQMKLTVIHLLFYKNISDSVQYYLISCWSVFLETFPAVNRSVARWLERYFCFLFAVCTDCLVHLSWTAGSEATASTLSASVIVSHISISLGFI